MYEIQPTLRPVAAPVMRGCRACDWQVWSDSAVVAELEQAAHRVSEHATLPERLRIQRLVTEYRELLGPLSERLLVLAVDHVLDRPAPLAAGEGAAA
ncbi:hypothetical protein [Nocardiopsis sp. NPDC057823]|uniref:hypothetical protein n=1 Tax=Nocardiopsis sp. NPDC057823 TaxID=3346256 RepID=UPI00366FC9F8